MKCDLCGCEDFDVFPYENYPCKDCGGRVIIDLNVCKSCGAICKSVNGEILIGIISLKLSSLGYDYLKRVDFDTEEAEFLELYYKEIDKYVETEDIIGLLNINDFINGNNKLNKKLFTIKLQKWQEKKLKQRRKELEGKKNT